MDQDYIRVIWELEFCRDYMGMYYKRLCIGTTGFLLVGPDGSDGPMLFLRP